MEMKYNIKLLLLTGQTEIELPKDAIILHFEKTGYFKKPEASGIMGRLYYLSPQKWEKKEDSQ